MYNLHTHSLLSDGCLLPSEIAARYADKGYKLIAITDHVDQSNIEFVTKSIRYFIEKWPKNAAIKILPGVELTHLPLNQFISLSKYARKNGMKIIIAHGQTPVEPVYDGTNLAALEADIDILAHPGYITDEAVKKAKEKNVFLEVTTRKGHNLTNSIVIAQALKFDAKMIINHDSHRPEDIISPSETKQLALEAGLNNQSIEKIYNDLETFLKFKKYLI